MAQAVNIAKKTNDDQMSMGTFKLQNTSAHYAVKLPSNLQGNHTLT